ncbi:MAG TPA: hypothetical protein VMF59_16755, partial [Bacteroidota bacterium]|nr:hypothetical protein [Bacteroidota bacterium]
QITVPELSLGIPVFESGFVQVAPFAGLSGVFISPPKDANGNSTSSLELNQFSWSAGLNLDWKMGGADPMRAYWFIRTRLTISSPFPQPDRRFAGNIVTFTVDVGFFGRSLMRDF